MVEYDLLIKLIAAHLIGDFFLQPKKWVDDKEQNSYKSPYLYIHTFLHAALVYLFVSDPFNWQIPLSVFVIHSIIDIFKSKIKSDDAGRFIIDQLLHFISIVIIWLVFANVWPQLSEGAIVLIRDHKTWLLLCGYLIIFNPMAFLIGKLTFNWQIQIENDGLSGAGKYIGMLERFIVLTFILFNRYEAIGFLLAAKSIFRFGDLRDSKERKKTEYILIGTLLSFALTILVGIGINILI